MPQSGAIKVMRIITRLIIGGPTLHVVNLNAGLPGRYSSLLVAGSGSRNEAAARHLATARGLRLKTVPEMGREPRLGLDAAAIFRLYRLMQRDRPHIVHTHTAKAGFLGRVAARLAGVPVVCHTFHGHSLKGYFGPVKTKAFLLLEKCLARGTQRIITVSPRVGRELVALGVVPARRLTGIPLGFDLQPFTRQVRYSGVFRRELGMASNQPLAAYVGRLVPIKNLELFLEAAAIVRRRLPQAHFAFVGDGEVRRELELKARDLGLAAAVHFTGWRQDLPPIYADLDATVVCSHNEGTPVSLIEAMATGCPVVATRVGGVPDLIADGITGRLAPPGDAPALARALLSAFQHPPQTAAMARQAQDFVLRHYTVDRLLADMDRLYSELLQGRGLG